MLMPKKNRVQIYEHLFKEGVMVAEKDFFLAKHPEVDVPNLHVIKTMQSLRSRGYVTEKFSWRHFYWYLTNEGINYLREFLHLPPEIVPATLKRQVRPEGSSRPRPSRGDRPTGDSRDSRDSRKTDEKQAAVGSGGGEFQFRGGYGRGNRPDQS